MKSATRRYAKRQVQWIRNKLLPTIWKSEKVHIYLLDATGKPLVSNRKNNVPDITKKKIWTLGMKMYEKRRLTLQKARGLSHCGVPAIFALISPLLAFCDGLALPDPSEFGETAATLLSKTDTLLE